MTVDLSRVRAAADAALPASHPLRKFLEALPEELDSHTYLALTTSIIRLAKRSA